MDYKMGKMTAFEFKSKQNNVEFISGGMNRL